MKMKSTTDNTYWVLNVTIIIWLSVIIWTLILSKHTKHLVLIIQVQIGILKN